MFNTDVLLFYCFIVLLFYLYKYSLYINNIATIINHSENRLISTSGKKSPLMEISRLALHRVSQHGYSAISG